MDLEEKENVPNIWVWKFTQIPLRQKIQGLYLKEVNQAFLPHTLVPKLVILNYVLPFHQHVVIDELRTLYHISLEMFP